MVLPDREADWKPVQELVFGRIKEIFQTNDEEEEQKAPKKRTYEQVKALFKISISIMLKNLPKNDFNEIIG